jgi:hypothetical protein
MPENQVFNFNYYQLCYNYYDQSLDMTQIHKKIHHCSTNSQSNQHFCKKIPTNPAGRIANQPAQEQRTCGHALLNVWHSSQGACARQYMVRQAGCWASPSAHPPFPSLCDSANLFRLSTGCAGGFRTTTARI